MVRGWFGGGLGVIWGDLGGPGGNLENSEKPIDEIAKEKDQFMAVLKGAKELPSKPKKAKSADTDKVADIKEKAAS